jgi:hypothetical protein
MRGSKKQSEFAYKIRISPNYFSQIEADLRKPNRRVLASLVDVYLQERQIDDRDFKELRATILKDIIPTIQYEILQDNRILIEFNTGIRAELLLNKKTTKLHEETTQDILTAVLKDTALRLGLHAICTDNELSDFVKDITENRRMLKLVRKLTTLKNDQLKLIESVLKNF